MEKVDILIIHLNGEKIIQDCLSSIYKDNKNASVYVLFNNTSDNSEKIVKKVFPKVKTYKTQSKKTLGFAEASNIIIKKSKSKYVVFLNNDTIVEKNWLSEMLKTLKKNKNCIAVQPKVKSYNNREYFEYAGAAGGFIDKYGFPFCRGRIFNSIEKDTSQYDDSIRIFWACGVCMLLDRNFFISSGGFDESLFMYAEEIDFCWRANLFGKEIWYSPKSTIYHIGSFSVNNDINFKKEYFITKNHIIIFLKNHNFISLVKLMPIRLALELIAAIRFPTKKALAFVKSIFLVPYIYLTKTRKERKLIQAKRIASDKDLQNLIYDKSIAFEYFIKGKKTFKDLLSA